MAYICRTNGLWSCKWSCDFALIGRSPLNTISSQLIRFSEGLIDDSRFLPVFAEDCTSRSRGLLLGAGSVLLSLTALRLFLLSFPSLFSLQILILLLLTSRLSRMSPGSRISPLFTLTVVVSVGCLHALYHRPQTISLWSMPYTNCSNFGGLNFNTKLSYCQVILFVFYLSKCDIIHRSILWKILRGFVT